MAKGSRISSVRNADTDVVDVFFGGLVESKTPGHASAPLSAETTAEPGDGIIYRVLKIDIYDPDALAQLSKFKEEADVNPKIWQSVKELVICDDYEPSQSPVSDILPQLLIKNLKSRVSMVLNGLKSVTSVKILCRRGFLDWRVMHPFIQSALINVLSVNTKLLKAKLCGIIHIPQAPMQFLINLDYLSWDTSRFAIDDAPLKPIELSPLPAYLLKTGTELPPGVPEYHRNRSLYAPQTIIFRALSSGEASNIPMWTSLPSTSTLYISLTSVEPASIHEGFTLLCAAGSKLEHLRVSTIEMELGFMAVQPPADPEKRPEQYRKLTSWVSYIPPRNHGPRACEDRETVTLRMPKCSSRFKGKDKDGNAQGSGWFQDLMKDFNGRMVEGPKAFESLKMITLVVSHWCSAPNFEANGELAWAVSFLDCIPAETAARVECITLDVRVGNSFCGHNTAHAIPEFFRWQGWAEFDAVLAGSRPRSVGGDKEVGDSSTKWTRLQLIRMRVRSTLCCFLHSQDEDSSTVRLITQGLRKIQTESLKRTRALRGVTVMVDYIDTSSEEI